MNCQIEIDHDENAEMIKWKIVKAVKEHKCDECNMIILKGEEYEYYKGKYEGYLFTNKTCNDCLSLRIVLFSSCFEFGNVRNDIVEAIQNDSEILPWKDLGKLTTAAQDWLFKKIEETWKNEEEE